MAEEREQGEARSRLTAPVGNAAKESLCVIFLRIAITICGLSLGLSLSTQEERVVVVEPWGRKVSSSTMASCSRPHNPRPGNSNPNQVIVTRDQVIVTRDQVIVSAYTLKPSQS